MWTLVKDYSHSERGILLLLVLINSKGSFICCSMHQPTDRVVHTMAHEVAAVVFVSHAPSYLMPYNHKLNVLSVLLNKKFPFLFQPNNNLFY